MLVRMMLDSAIALIGELPWHLTASMVYSGQPSVLSGQAWSHGSESPRLIRVIDWTEATPGSRVKVWNRNRRNPIMTDAVFIERPGASGSPSRRDRGANRNK
jgi:hypothetical protein